MKHLFTTAILIICFWLSVAGGIISDSPTPFKYDNEENKGYVYSESGGGGVISCSEDDNTTSIMSLQAKTVSRSETGYLGRVIVNKLVYAVFDFGLSVGAEPDKDIVATLMGWADSYDYYPDLVVPDWIRFNGRQVPVTTVNDRAFVNGWGITSLKLGKNIGMIGPRAFAGCAFPEVTIPYRTCYIFNFAFYSGRLTSVEFRNPNRSKPALHIGPGAFAANLITKFEVPARARIYDNGTLSFWWSTYGFLTLNPLKKIIINDCYGKRISSRSEDWGYDEDPYEEEIGEEDTLDAENGLAFEIIDNALCVVKTEADGSRGINVVTYPQECEASSFVLDSDRITVWSEAMASSANLTSVTLKSHDNTSNTSLSINGDALSGCSNLKSLNLSADNGQIFLGAGFSSDCSSLTEINMGENSNYTVTDNVIYTKNYDDTYLVTYPAGKTETEFTVPSNVRYIYPMSFQGNGYLCTLNLPDGLAGIHNNAFSNCHRLSTINYTGNSLDFIGENAFSNTEFISKGGNNPLIWNGWLVGYDYVPSNLVLDNSFSHIADGLFMSRYELESVEFTGNLTTIPASCFAACGNLRKIVWPSNLERIGTGAFQSTAMEDIGIPHGVTTIDSYAFTYSPVNRIYLPPSITKLNNGALLIGTGIAPTEIIADMSTPPALYGNSIFDDLTLSSSTLVIPEGVDPQAFTSAPGWGFSNVINRKLDRITEIAEPTSTFTIEGHTIISSVDSTISLYGIDGALLGQGHSIDIPAHGLYIIVCGTKTSKIAF